MPFRSKSLPFNPELIGKQVYLEDISIDYDDEVSGIFTVGGYIHYEDMIFYTAVFEDGREVDLFSTTVEEAVEVQEAA